MERKPVMVSIYAERLAEDLIIVNQFGTFY